jgi:hypothetical protein
MIVSVDFSSDGCGKCSPRPRNLHPLRAVETSQGDAASEAYDELTIVTSLLWWYRNNIASLWRSRLGLQHQSKSHRSHVQHGLDSHDFFGCTYYPWSALGHFPILQKIVLVNPLVYASEGLRATLVPQYPHLPLLAVLIALTIFDALFLGAGLLQFRRKAVS